MAKIKRDAIRQTPRKQAFNRAETTRALGIRRRALRYKLHRFEKLGYAISQS